MFAKITCLLLVSNIIFLAHADDELKGDKAWLADFARTKFVQAKANIYSEKQEQWNRQEYSEISLNFESYEYYFVYDLSLSENWDVLTKDGAELPPTIDRYSADSEVKPWSNFKGIGTYSERFERVVPNWQVFDKLGPLLEVLGSYEYTALLNGVFYDDEIKMLKKLYNRNDAQSSAFWQQLEYNEKGHAIGVSSDFLTRKDFTSSKSSVIISNEKGQELKFEPIEISLDEIVSGVKLSLEGHELVVFSRSLNKMMFKFAPELFPDPELVFTGFLWNLQEIAGKEFDRFSNNLAINE